MTRGAPQQRRQNSGIVTATPTSKSSIPRTTIFTPPPSCNDIVTYDGTSLWQNGVHRTGDAGCYPPSYPAVYQSFYSPGICPQSWKSVGSFAHSSGFNAACCPSSFFLSTTINTDVSGFNLFCASLMTTALSNVYSAPSLKDGIAPVDPKLITLATAQVSSTTVFADLIQVSWASSNTAIVSLMKEQSAAAASKSPATTGGKTAGLATPTSSPSSSSSSSGGLSTGAKIGIGIGVPLAIIAIAALLLLVVISRRRRRGKNMPRSVGQKQNARDGPYYELHSDYVGQAVPTEMDARSIVELPVSELRPETRSQTPPANPTMSQTLPPWKRMPSGTRDEMLDSIKEEPASPKKYTVREV